MNSDGSFSYNNLIYLTWLRFKSSLTLLSLCLGGVHFITEQLIEKHAMKCCGMAVPWLTEQHKTLVSTVVLSKYPFLRTQTASKTKVGLACLEIQRVFSLNQQE